MPDKHDDFSDDRIDSLVRSYLVDDAKCVDTVASLDAILGQLAAGEGASRRTSRAFFWRRPRWIAGLAASVFVLATTFYVILSPASTNAYSVVLAAHQALTPQSDRCYQVEVSVPPFWSKRQPLLAIGPHTRLWTRGNRFRVEDDREGGLVWGQDGRGNVWFMKPHTFGVIFERDEVPPAIVKARTFLNLDMAKLTQRLLQAFDLELDTSFTGKDPDLVAVRAKARPDNDQMQVYAGRLVINRQTNVIQRLEISRQTETSIPATVAFELVGGEPQSDASYRLDGNLAPQLPAYDQTKPIERKEKIGEFFSP